MYEGPYKSLSRTFKVSHEILQPSEEGDLITCCQNANYLFATYAKNDIIDKIEAKNEELLTTPIYVWRQIFISLKKESLRCGFVCEEARLEGAFIKALHESVGIAIRTDWRAQRDTMLQSWALFVTSLIKTPDGSNSTSTHSCSSHYDDHKSKKSIWRGENTLITTVQEHRGSNSCSISSNPFSEAL